MREVEAWLLAGHIQCGVHYVRTQAQRPFRPALPRIWRRLLCRLEACAMRSYSVAMALSWCCNCEPILRYLRLRTAGVHHGWWYCGKEPKHLSEWMHRCILQRRPMLTHYELLVGQPKSFSETSSGSTIRPKLLQCIGTGDE